MKTSKNMIIRANYFERNNATEYSLQRTQLQAPNATLSALWSAHEITLRINLDCAECLYIRCGQLEQTRKIVQNKIVISFSTSVLGIKIIDLNQTIPLSIEITNQSISTVFDGQLQLCDYQTYYSNPCNYANSFSVEKISEAGSQDDFFDKNLGSKICADGYILFDRYSKIEPNRETSNHLLIANNLKNITHHVPLFPTNIAEFNDDILSIPEKKNKIEISRNTQKYILECEINVLSMPIYESDRIVPVGIYSCGFYFVVSLKESNISSFFGIYRTNNGLCFFVNNSINFSCIPIGKQLGERFHLEVVWHNDQSLDVYVDRQKLFTFSSFYTKYKKCESFTPNAITIRMQRRFVAQSTEDNFEIIIRNLNLIKDKTASILSLLSSEQLFGKPVSENTEFSVLTSPLTLKKSVTDINYQISVPIDWHSSNENVLKGTGKISRPERIGEPVILTLQLLNGDIPVLKTDYYFFIPATNPQGNVLCLKNDYDPYTGSAVFEDTAFVFNKGENSIVYDFGKSVTITHASLCGMNNESIFVNKTLIGLYVSEDNKNYQRINDFTLLNEGETVHFYNFAVQARYLKLHNVDATETAPIRGSLQKMFQATADTLFLRDGGKEFTQRAFLKIQNTTDKSVLDKICSYSLSELPIDIQKANQDLSDLRFLYNGKLLPHAIVDGKLYLRFYELPAKANIEIQILYGNPSATSLENAPETFEMQYGTRSIAPICSNSFWVKTVEKMPNGDLLQITARDWKIMYTRRSLDFGRTWSDWGEISNSASVKPMCGGGLITDRETNTVFYIGYCDYDIPNRITPPFVMESHDSGLTWSDPKKIPTHYSLAASYSDGLKLHHSKNGVDYVFSFLAMKNKDTPATCSAFYSCDKGKTWETSFSDITYGSIEAQKKTIHGEGGCTEDTLYEKEDGTLVMWNRYETAAFEPHFVVSRSYDSGITWGETHLGNVFTANTQPIITKYRGIPLLMWGGNNAMGSTSHVRLPLSIAYSDDEAESFRGIQNLIFQSQYSELTNRFEITNPDIVIDEYHGIDHAFIVAKEYRVLIEDFGNVIFKTKGAYDSFEHSTPYEEGWLPFAGTPDVTEREGKRCMHLGNGVCVSRSFPEIRKGEISLTFYADQIGSGFALELQAAYTNLRHVAAPVSLAFDKDGILYTAKNIRTNIKLQSGKNTLHLIFDGTQTTATLTLNGNSTEIPYDYSIAPYLCYINLWNQPDCNLDIERFIAIDTEDHAPKYEPFERKSL